MKRTAAYLQLHDTGELTARIERARSVLESCELCPHLCRVNRLEDERGKCRTGLQAMVSSCGPHFGEESPLVGQNGSGTIFSLTAICPASSARTTLSASLEREERSGQKSWQR
jgi:putative pyruvate formate lyase activating enzyme